MLHWKVHLRVNFEERLEMYKKLTIALVTLRLMVHCALEGVFVSAIEDVT